MDKKGMRRLLTYSLLLMSLLTGCFTNQNAYENTPSEDFNSTQSIHAIPAKLSDISYSEGFLTGIPCSAPCFLDITPGITTKDEMYIYLEKHKVNQFCVETKLDDDRGYIVDCQSELFFHHNGDKITYIAFYPHPQITLDEIIAKYGEPDFVNLITYGSKEISIIKNVFFSTPQIKLHFPIYNVSSDDPYLNNNELTKELYVEWVEIVTEDKVQRFQTDKCTIPWYGFGKYEINYDC